MNAGMSQHPPFTIFFLGVFREKPGDVGFWWDFLEEILGFMGFWLDFLGVMRCYQGFQLNWLDPYAGKWCQRAWAPFPRFFCHRWRFAERTFVQKIFFDYIDVYNQVHLQSIPLRSTTGVDTVSVFAKKVGNTKPKILRVVPAQAWGWPQWAWGIKLTKPESQNDM